MRRLPLDPRECDWRRRDLRPGPDLERRSRQARAAALLGSSRPAQSRIASQIWRIAMWAKTSLRANTKEQGNSRPSVYAGELYKAPALSASSLFEAIERAVILADV